LSKPSQPVLTLFSAFDSEVEFAWNFALVSLSITLNLPPRKTEDGMDESD